MTQQPDGRWTVYREGCGTRMGLLLHQAGGEQPCATCLHREQVRLLELELAPTRPTGWHPKPKPAPEDEEPPPVSKEAASVHRRVLLAELDAFEASPAWRGRVGHHDAA